MCHNPYFNRWFSAILDIKMHYSEKDKVTILILIDGFLQFNMNISSGFYCYGHNPYFNRWFSAIKQESTKKELKRMSQSLF